MSTIESVLQENRVFEPAEQWVAQAHLSKADYEEMCARAEEDYEGYWAQLARDNLVWHKPFTKVLNESNAPFYKWFEDGHLNASYNCLDRHLLTQPNRTAIIFEADDGTVTKVSYRQLHHRVCQFANGLKKLGVRKGDRVLVYLPMSIEAVVARELTKLHEEARRGTLPDLLAWAREKSPRGEMVILVAPRASRPGSTPSTRCSSSSRRARPASRRASSSRPAATCCRRCAR